MGGLGSLYSSTILPSKCVKGLDDLSHIHHDLERLMVAYYYIIYYKSKDTVIMMGDISMTSKTLWLSFKHLNEMPDFQKCSTPIIRIQLCAGMKIQVKKNR